MIKRWHAKFRRPPLLIAGAHGHKSKAIAHFLNRLRRFHGAARQQARINRVLAKVKHKQVGSASYGHRDIVGHAGRGGTR